MIASYTTEDGITLEVFSTLYVDWGIHIHVDGEELFYGPCHLSNDAYGHHWEDEDGNELDEGIPWTEKKWKACLEAEADDLIEGFVGWDKIEALENEESTD